MFAMIVDLLYGIKKAKERGELRTSVGYRQTVDKAIKYIFLLVLFFCVDAIKLVVFTFPPIFSAIAGMYICFIEFKSWLEKAGEKEVRNIRQVADLYLNRKELVEEIIKQVEKNNKNK